MSSSEDGAMLFLLLQLLFLMVCLTLIGEPFRAFFLRRLKLFADLDFIQILLIDVYLGGFALYVIAMLPLQLFDGPVVLGLTALGFLFFAFRILKFFSSGGAIREARDYLLGRKTAVMDYTLLFVMFLIFFLIQLVSLSNFIFGSIHDTSLHSLMVEVILENGQVPATLQPYLSEGIIYPQAAHVIFAYAAHLLNFEAPKAVYFATSLFNSLSVFGAYFLGKRLWNNRSFYLGLSFVFAFVSAWPLYVTWGGNPFVTGFPLFLVCLGLFFSISQSRTKTEVKELAVIGLLFGYSAAIMISYLETLMVIGFLWMLYGCFSRSKHRWDMAKTFFLTFGISLLPLSPFLGRFIVFYSYPGHNVGIPGDFAGWEKQQISLAQALEWAFRNVSPYLFLRLALTFLLISLGILLWKIESGRNVKRVLFFAAAVFLSSTLLSFVAYFLSADFGVISWGHQSIIMIIPISICVVVFYMKLVQLFNGLGLKWFSQILSRRSYAVLLVSIISLGTINTPFVYYRLVEDPQNLASMYGLFAVTNQDDYNLMLWMRENLSREAVVLVNPYEPGLFIPTISHHKIVFPYSGSQLAYGYQRLVKLITHNMLNTTAYDFMSNYNITYVFVGHDSTYWWETSHKWNPNTFLNNPNFKLVKRFGKSYLLQLSHFDPYFVFLDEFDYVNLSDMGWVISNGSNGNGEAEIISLNGKNFLKMTSERETNKTSDLYFYEIRVSREVFVWTNSNVMFSFNLNSSSGFNNLDTFAFVISNIYLNRSITIATPNGVFEFLDPNGTRTFALENFTGNFSFDLSRLWEQTYNCALPKELVLQIRNIDFDGVDNTVLIGSIMLWSQEN